ncbi:unnamed protein product [Coccothraustes coccothraustes]
MKPSIVLLHGAAGPPHCRMRCCWGAAQQGKARQRGDRALQSRTGVSLCPDAPALHDPSPCESGTLLQWDHSSLLQSGHGEWHCPRERGNPSKLRESVTACTMAADNA